MSIIIKNASLNEKKLIDFGFVKTERQHIAASFKKDFVLNDSGFFATVSVFADGNADYTVFDCETGEEYVLVKESTGAQGSYVGYIRGLCEELVDKVVLHCYDKSRFRSRLLLTASAYAKKKYDSTLEYLWEKTPENAILRREDNKKWYAAFLTVKGTKIGLNNENLVEILNLHADKETIKRIVDNKNFFPGWHMNKNSWITVTEYSQMSDEYLFELIDNSFALGKGK